VLLVPAHEGEPLAIGRKDWRRGFAQAGGEASRQSTGGWHAPQIVIANEYDGVTLDGGLTQIALLDHAVSMVGDG
jgi:hypothetical protein